LTQLPTCGVETSDIQKDAIGAIIELTIQQKGSIINISSASATKQIILKKPDNTKLTKTASFTTDGTDGKLQYITIAGDIDQIGDWQAQAYIVMVGFIGYTSPITFTVNDNL
jgi:hypothetical protein